MGRKLVYAAGGVVVFLVLVILLLPLLVNVNSYRPSIETAMAGALNRKVDLGNIRLSIFSGGVSLDDVSISEDPAFGNIAFLKAKSITVGVRLLPLIFSHALHVTGLTIEEPEVTLLRAPSGAWNFSSLGAGTATQTKDAAPPASAANVSVALLRIRDGKLYIGKVGANAKRREYDQLDLQISDLSNTTQFPFTFSAQAPGNGSIKLSGQAGPLNQTNVQATPVDASLEVRSLDLTFTGFADPSSGIAGLLDFTGSVNSDGKQIHSKGVITATKLQLVPGSSPASKPVELDYDTNYQMQPQTGALTQCDVHIGKALAQLTGTYSAAGEVASVQMKLDGEKMPAADLEGVLPALGVAMPSGASLKEGTMNADLTIVGPVNALVTAGPVNLDSAKISGFNIGEKMGALSSFAGVPKSPDTVIQTFRSDVRVTPEGIKADRLNLVVQGIGTLDGSGTVSADHALDFKMSAQLSGGASALGAISKVAGGKKGLPFLIKGTTTNPQFVPDVAGLAGGLGKGILGGGQSAASGTPNLGSALGGLLGQKKK